MLHSGSRGVGNRIGSDFVALAKAEARRWFLQLPDPDLAYFPEGTELFRDYLHAVTTSEAETLKTNADFGDQLRFQLVFIFPSEGTFWSEQPYCVLDAEWVSPEQRSASETFRDYLLDSPQQELAVDYYLRPVDESLVLHAPLALEDGTDPRVTRDSVPSLEFLTK